MRAKLAHPNDCAASFLSRAVVNLRWYYYLILQVHVAEVFRCHVSRIVLLIFYDFASICFRSLYFQMSITAYYDVK